MTITHPAPWHQGACDLRYGEWPYDCAAKDKGEKTPVVCVTHLVWWLCDDDYTDHLVEDTDG